MSRRHTEIFSSFPFSVAQASILSAPFWNYFKFFSKYLYGCRPILQTNGVSGQGWKYFIWLSFSHCFYKKINLNFLAFALYSPQKHFCQLGLLGFVQAVFYLNPPFHKKPGSPFSYNSAYFPCVLPFSPCPAESVQFTAICRKLPNLYLSFCQFFQSNSKIFSLSAGQPPPFPVWTTRVK